MLFRSSISLLILSTSVLSSIKGGIVKIPFIIMDLYISPCRFSFFSFMYFKHLLHNDIGLSFFSLETDLLVIVIAFFVLHNILCSEVCFDVNIVIPFSFLISVSFTYFSILLSLFVSLYLKHFL